MIIKLTAAGRNESIYVNFYYVRTIRRDGTFTELVMSDDKYHKLTVLETPEEIYDKLCPTSTCYYNCQCAENAKPTQEVKAETNQVKKTTTKKTQTKAVEPKTTK